MKIRFRTFVPESLARLFFALMVCGVFALPLAGCGEGGSLPGARRILDLPAGVAGGVEADGLVVMKAHES